MKKYWNVIWQVIFWLIICYVFTHYSYLRPGAIGARYKEVICVIMIAGMVYLNYLYLIPIFFQQGKIKLYWFLAICSVIAVGLGEFYLVRPEIIKCSSAIPSEVFKKYLIVTAILIIFRDFGFFLFFFLIRIYKDLTNKYLNLQQVFRKDTNLIYIQDVENKSAYEVDTESIVYMTQKENYTYFHLDNHTKIKQHSTLSEMEQILAGSHIIRINRSNMINILQVIDFTDNIVKMNLVENNEYPTLIVTDKYLADTKEKISAITNVQKAYNSDFGTAKSEDCRSRKSNSVVKTQINAGNSEEKSLQNNQEESQSEYYNEEKVNALIEDITNNLEKEKGVKLNITTQDVLKQIILKQGMQVPEIIDLVHRSYRNVQSHISILVKHNLVEYRGTPKFGGYYTVEDYGDLLVL